MTELCDIATKIGTDKAPFYWDYTPIYYDLLSQMDVRTVLEIGVLSGQSLLTWRDFLPNAQVYGIDNEPGCMVTGQDRIKTFCCDAYNMAAMEPILAEIGQVDLLIDDAVHFGGPQLFLLSNLWQLVRPGGAYVIEETRDDARTFVKTAVSSLPNVASLRMFYGNHYAGSGYSLSVVRKK